MRIDEGRLTVPHLQLSWHLGSFFRKPEKTYRQLMQIAFHNVSCNFKIYRSTCLAAYQWTLMPFLSSAGASSASAICFCGAANKARTLAKSTAPDTCKPTALASFRALATTCCLMLPVCVSLPCFNNICNFEPFPRAFAGYIRLLAFGVQRYCYGYLLNIKHTFTKVQRCPPVVYAKNNIRQIIVGWC